MRVAIDLNYDALFETTEVGEKSKEWILTPESCPPILRRRSRAHRSFSVAVRFLPISRAGWRVTPSRSPRRYRLRMLQPLLTPPPATLHPGQVTSTTVLPQHIHLE